MNIENIVEEFKNHLEHETIIVPLENKQIDLYSFFKALTELKTETKRSAKQVQSSLHSFKEAFSLMEDQIKSQEDMRKTLITYHDAELSRFERVHVLELIDYKDRAQRNINESEYLFHKIKKSWFVSRLKKKVLGLSQGLQLSLDQVDSDLQRKGVERIETSGLSFNPKIMKISEVVYNNDMKNLVVLDEVISGYLGKNNQVIRYAEVIVNKHKGT